MYLESQSPKYAGELHINNGITDSVYVVYDTYAIPHITAKSEEDAFFALGYAHAQERLFQMDLIRRLAKGELAEILGPKLIPTDKMMRTLGIKEMAINSAKEFRQQQPKMDKAAEAYLNGINYFIAKDRLPVEFTILGYKPTKFTLEDSYCNLGYMALGFTMTMKEEPLMEHIYESLGDAYLTDLGLDSASNYDQYYAAKPQEEALASIMKELQKAEQNIPLPLWEGSNNWAISAKRSKSGKALLANDTHIKYGQPSVWFEANLTYPNGGIYGYFLAGVPFPIMGHNENLGWGLTIFPVDNMDMYLETQNPDNVQEYRVLDHWEHFKMRKEIIKVKGEKDLVFEIRSTRHGAVLNDAYNDIAKNNNQPVSLWWVLNKINTKAFEATYKMMHAQNIGEFEKAMPDIDLLGLNVVYADKDDNIAWWACAKIPKRPQGVNSKRYIDGANDSLNHLVFYDFKDNPQSVNPAEGYIVTANNAPPAVHNINYPGYYAPGYRAQRLKDLIVGQEKWDVESMKRLQLDNHSDRDMRLAELIYSEAEISDKEVEMMDLLDRWDGNYDVNSKGAIVYNRLIYFILKDAMEDELGEEVFSKLKTTYALRSKIEKLFMNEESVWWDNKNTEKKESRSDIFTLAVNQTYESLTKQLTPDYEAWKWGNVHQLEFVHPIGRKKPMDKIFNLGPFPMPGGNEVVDKEGFTYSDESKYMVTSGPAMRLLMDFSKPYDAIGVIPTGQSGNFMSPHYSDQMELFINGKYRKQISRNSDLPEESTRVLFVP
ncbi:MAG: penicillin acylase family protein, partial [Bacteroidetes bacterium]